MFEKQIDTAKYYFKRSIALASKKNKVSSTIALGTLYKKTGNYEASILLFNTLLTEPNLTIRNKGIIHSKLASTHSLNTDFKKASFHFKKAISLIKLIDDKGQLATCEINYANFYKNNSLFNLALPLYESSLTYFTNTIDYLNYVIATINYAYCYYELDNNTKALTILETLNEQKLLEFNNPELLAGYYNLKSITQQNTSRVNTKEIFSNYQKSVDFAYKSNDINTLTYLTNYIDYATSKNNTSVVKSLSLKFNLDSMYSNTSIIGKTTFLKSLNERSITTFLVKTLRTN